MSNSLNYELKEQAGIAVEWRKFIGILSKSFGDKKRETYSDRKIKLKQMAGDDEKFDQKQRSDDRVTAK